ncbi:hypothetical protein [Elizabethkingia anophelis]|uniref:hypothetical protein n=1 Tax=Elizabethkingia anophelis TaxID=1117645 RepID=UPI00301C39A6
MKINICVILFCCLSLQTFAQIKIHKGYSELKESPANGRKIDKVTILFDNDAVKDVLMLVKNEAEFSSYKLLIYLSSFQKQFEVELFSANDFSFYPVQLKPTKNIVQFGYFQDGTATFGRFVTLRFNTTKNKVQVIGYDVDYEASSTEFINKSYNLLTGKYIVKRTELNANGTKKTQEFSGKNNVFKNAVFIEDLNEEMYRNLDDVGSKDQ